MSELHVILHRLPFELSGRHECQKRLALARSRLARLVAGNANPEDIDAATEALQRTATFFEAADRRVADLKAALERARVAA